MTTILQIIKKDNIIIEQYQQSIALLWRVYVDGVLHRDQLMSKPSLKKLLNLYGS